MQVGYSRDVVDQSLRQAVSPGVDQLIPTASNLQTPKVWAMPQSPNDTHFATRLRTLSIGLAARGIAVLHQDAMGRYDLAENLPLAWPADCLERTDAEILPPALADHFTAARKQCLATGTDQVINFELAEPTRRRHFEARIAADAPGIVIVLIDVTDEHKRDIAVNALLREVSHRSKNLLAIVQSVAMQTAHHSDNINSFLDKFRGRLHALSSTQDLVTENDWRGTHFQTLVMAQLARIGSQALDHARITGGNPLLGPNAALHIGLAIHELAANALVHGALTPPHWGQIHVNARVEEAKGLPEQLIIEWHETIAHEHSARQAPRFGTAVLERIVPLSVGGSAHFGIDDHTVTYRLVVPTDQFEP